MASRVSACNVANAYKPWHLITAVSLECCEMRIPQEPVTTKVMGLSFCGPVDAYVSGRCNADGR